MPVQSDMAVPVHDCCPTCLRDPMCDMWHNVCSGHTPVDGCLEVAGAPGRQARQSTQLAPDDNRQQQAGTCGITSTSCRLTAATSQYCCQHGMPNKLVCSATVAGDTYFQGPPAWQQVSQEATCQSPQAVYALQAADKLSAAGRQKHTSQSLPHSRRAVDVLVQLPCRPAQQLAGNHIAANGAACHDAPTVTCRQEGTP